MLDDIDRYNRYATPTQYQGTATNVSMSMYIEGISSFSAQTMDYHLDMYFYQEWDDPRLAHNGSGPMLIRDKIIFKKMWHPDAYFANARYASFHSVTEDNFLVWVYPDGHVWYDCRISLVAICMMDLWKYPLDEQQCNLRILSYAYPESQVRLLWSTSINPPIDRAAGIRMPDMRLVDIKTGICDGTYATGKWSCMTAEFYVQREMMHHIIQTYVPTALIVVISWFNFWLDIDSAPARVSLSITTLLTIATQANAVKLALPEVSYMKAIDFWLGMCMTFVFGVMIEFTICHFAKNQELSMGSPNAPNLIVDSTMSTLFDTSSNLNDSIKRLKENNAEARDRFFKGIDPNALPSRNGRTLRPDEPDIHTIQPMPVDMEPMLKSLSSYGSHNGDARLNGLRDPMYPRMHSLDTLHMTEEKHNSIKPTMNRLRNQVRNRAISWKNALCNLRGRRVANKIDENCRYIFPLVFVVFNIFYWSFYLVIN
ncbi:unnamed protein product [Bursaphelenchus xylophilus]|uniref:(pine wood nematode) hypothetical protein n=1 Tax=Bursaphelenchus xylophilus TaxID=6326 RepID=A0A1I7SLL1_BURXY|nr:unnamed protein product [Bursaphelenchus xylophilus]CAG9129659.1 unnamed protein product [Bursaphelenchus xylophilus]